MEKKPVRLEKVFELLKEAAKTRGTHPNIEDPLPILQKNGFKKPGVLQYLKRLRDTGCVEMVHGEERNGWGIVKIILKKEAVPSAFIVKKRLTAQKEAGNPIPTPVKKNPRNRVIAFLDLENFVIGLEEKNRAFDMQKIQNLCENYGTFIWLRCFISEKTYQRSEFLFSGIIDNGTPITLVKNGKDSVDLFIRREIEKALEYDMADTFLIGTDDRGPTYQETVKKIGDCNKSFKFLTVQTEFPRILNEDDAGQTGAPSANSRESAIKNCVRALMRNNFPKTNAPQEQFLKEIAVILKRRIADSNPPTFFQLTAMIWNDLDGKTRESFDALDCQYAIGALHSIADVLISVKKGHRNSNGKKVHLYYLNQSNPLFSALTA